MVSWKILDDADSDFGFLHRLDVPSSGLILAAKTYAAYYDLQLQLRSRSLARDYVVLNHGKLKRHKVDARLFGSGFNTFQNTDWYLSWPQCTD